MKTLVSLFDLTGYAVEKFTELGWRTIIIDSQHASKRHPRASLAINMTISRERELEICALKPDLLFSFPPCTDLAVSGAKHFKRKLRKDPMCQKRAADLARTAERIGRKLGIPWMAENPISVLSTLWRKPDAIFDPFEYGGYLPADDEHPEWPGYILPRDAYPKRTCFWFGEGFEMPYIKGVPVKPGWSEQQKKLGGKSEKTKYIRSATPRGVFAAIAQDAWMYETHYNLKKKLSS